MDPDINCRIHGNPTNVDPNFEGGGPGGHPILCMIPAVKQQVFWKEWRGLCDLQDSETVVNLPVFVQMFERTFRCKEPVFFEVKLKICNALIGSYRSVRVPPQHNKLKVSDESGKCMYAWNPNDPLFDWQRPSFGAFNSPKQRTKRFQVCSTQSMVRNYPLSQASILYLRSLQ